MVACLKNNLISLLVPDCLLSLYGKRVRQRFLYIDILSIYSTSINLLKKRTIFIESTHNLSNPNKRKPHSEFRYTFVFTVKKQHITSSFCIRRVVCDRNCMENIVIKSDSLGLIQVLSFTGSHYLVVTNQLLKQANQSSHVICRIKMKDLCRK